jgi:hypothetical protein
VRKIIRLSVPRVTRERRSRVMSANFFEREYEAAAPVGPLRARQVGVRAALGMGIGASAILALAAMLIRPQPVTPSTADAGETSSVEAPAKMANKAETQTSADAKSAAFDLDAPEFDREKKVVAFSEPTGDGVRADSLTIGRFGVGAPFMRVDVHQGLDPKATNPDFFLDMTRHAQQVGLNVAKIGQRGTLQTRFGAFETADIRLSQPAGENAPGAERSCIATRLLDSNIPLEIAGIACGSAAKPIDRFALGCILDKLNYSANGDNKALNDFFLNAELARGKGCANVSHDDVTASIPRKVVHAKPAASKPVLAKPAQPKPAHARPAAKKSPAVARSAPANGETIAEN